jgi:hypothetical protein
MKEKIVCRLSFKESHTQKQLNKNIIKGRGAGYTPILITLMYN